MTINLRKTELVTWGKASEQDGTVGLTGPHSIKIKKAVRTPSKLRFTKEERSSHHLLSGKCANRIAEACCNGRDWVRW